MDKDAQGPEQSVKYGSWRRQEQAVDSRTSNKSGQGEEEDAVTMLAAMFLCGGGLWQPTTQYEQVADDAMTWGGAEDNGKLQECASDDGVMA